MSIEKNFYLQGSLLVEFVLCFHIFIILIVSFVVFSKWFSLRLQLLQAAQLGTDMQASSLMAIQDVEGNLRNLLAKNENTPFSFQMGRFRETPASPLYNFVGTQVKAPFSNNFLKRAGLENLMVNEK